MKKPYIITSIMLMLCFIISGCSLYAPKKEAIIDASLSNLVDCEVQNQYRTLLVDSGIDESLVSTLMADINQYNKTIEFTGLVPNGYIDFDGDVPKYDISTMSDLWGKVYPQFLGYNCRVTAYLVMKDGIRLTKDTSPSIPYDLTMLMQLAPEKVSDYFSEKNISVFSSLFISVQYNKNKSESDYSAEINEKWKDNGIEFDEAYGSELITVWARDESCDEEVSCVHAGVVTPGKDNVYFFEKTSFTGPYQLIVFTDREQLKEYLLIQWDTQESPCFIMDNSKLMH